jgi:hypothetical protein
VNHKERVTKFAMAALRLDQGRVNSRLLRFEVELKMSLSLARAATPPIPAVTLALVLAVALAGCGLAETGAAAAAGGASKAEELRRAKETEAKVKEQIDAAYQQAAEQRRAGEAASQ